MCKLFNADATSFRSNQKSQTKAEEDEAEGLAKLIPNIQKTAEIVKQVTGSMKKTGNYYKIKDWKK